MVMISERPAEAEDRALPGHWEGDLIIGAGGRSAIVTLVERHTRYVLLARLPGGRDAVAVRDALIGVVQTLPAHLWRSLTWDQGSEMARHHEFPSPPGFRSIRSGPAAPGSTSVRCGGSGAGEIAPNPGERTGPTAPRRD